MKTNMYAEAKTWNPFKGCRFGCSYCKPSFQLQAKRQKHNCDSCYRYEPHAHPDRLDRIPNAEIVFVCGNGDITFCPTEYLHRILGAIRVQNDKDAQAGRARIYYLQSKRPECLSDIVTELPANVVIVTTLETNRDEGYWLVSAAPPPSERYRQFMALKHPVKIVTIEPVMDFDEDVFLRWILDIRPAYIWLGFNSRPSSIHLPEPDEAKVQRFADDLARHGVDVRGKTLRGVRLATCRLENGN